jgi:hypothetical protein
MAHLVQPGNVITHGPSENIARGQAVERPAQPLAGRFVVGAGGQGFSEIGQASIPKSFGGADDRGVARPHLSGDGRRRLHGRLRAEPEEVVGDAALGRLEISEAGGDPIGEPFL